MTVAYKGVNLAGMEFGNAGSNRVNVDYVVPGKSDYDYWGQSVGSNVIRLPFTWERIQPQLGGSLNQEYLGYLKNSVQWAKQNGMTIALDLHNYARYNGQVVNSSQLTDVWKKLAAAFGGDDAVWFNLMNEPNNISASQWANTTQQTVNDLRAAGIDNKLLLSGTAWSGAHSWESSGNAAAYNNFKDPMNNFAFDVHQYLDSDSSGTSGNAVPGSGSTRLVKATQWAEAHDFQLFLGEAGVGKNSQAYKEMGDMMQYMENHDDTWLGWTLWGAGPWWGNYYLEINPQGSQHDPAIAALMKYMTPGDPGPDPNPDPNPGPQPEPSPIPVTGIDANNTTGATTIQGSTKDDIVRTWEDQMDAGDIIQLGQGSDTLQFRNTGLTFNSGLYANLSGIDRVDVSASTGGASVTLDSRFVQASDAKQVTIHYGAAGMALLDTSGIDEANHNVVLAGKGGTVTLSNAGNEVVLGAGNLGTVKSGTAVDTFILATGAGTQKIAGFQTGTGGDILKIPGVAKLSDVTIAQNGADTLITKGSDSIRLLGVSSSAIKPENFGLTPPPVDPDPDPDPSTGKTFNATSRTDNITGTTGNDTVSAYIGQLSASDSIKLGSGNDTLKMLSGGFTLDTSLFPKLTGIDRMDVTTAGQKAKIILDNTFMNATDDGELTVSFGANRGTLDTSKLTQGSFQVTWQGNTAKIALTDNPGPDPGPEPVEGKMFYASSKAETITGTDGNDSVEGFRSQINAGDVYDMGKGTDTVIFRSYSSDFDSQLYAGFKGIDRLDVTNVAHMELTLDNGFMSRTDNKTLSIKYDLGGIEMLDTSAVDSSQYKIRLEGGGGEVHLWNGNDTLYGSDGIDVIFGHGGNDRLQGGGGADKLNGGAGNDIFSYAKIGDAGDIIQGYEKGDRLDLTELLAANNIGSVDQAIAGGKLNVSQSGANAVVKFDGATLATIENTNIDDVMFMNAATI